MTTTAPVGALDSNVARSTGTQPGGIYTAVQPDQKTPSGELGKDAFLKLLVAQMKYQDPTNPADGTEFIAQTAQFTVVEKLAAMSEQNDKLLASQQTLTASTFIGRDVAWSTKDSVDGTSTLHSGTVTGVSFSADGPKLRVGKEDVALSDITAVAPVIDQTPTTTTPTEDDDSTTGTTGTTGTTAA